MASCKHQAWFDVSGSTNFHLHTLHRANALVADLPFPDTQYPSTIFFIGKEAKKNVLRQLFPNNNVGRGNANGLVNLHLDSTTSNSDYPIFFADSDPYRGVAARLGTYTCHRMETLPIAWRQGVNETPVLPVYARLISLFADIVCLFADDFSSPSQIAALLLPWIRIGNPSDSSIKTRPRVIIVASEQTGSATYTVLDLEEIRYLVNQIDRRNRALVFASVTVMQMSGT